MKKGVFMEHVQQALVVEGYGDVCLATCKWLSFGGWHSTCANSIEKARAALATAQYDLVILDLQMPDGEGLDIVPDVLKHNPAADTVIVVPDSALGKAVEAIRLGVVDFVQRPLTHEDFVAMLRRVTVRRALREGRVEQKVDRISAMISLIVERLGAVESDLALLRGRLEAEK
jgi:DNA-binding NtrC family response regulator